MINQNFWQDKRVLVTGARGFMGSNVVKELARLGARVYALAGSGNRPTNPVFLEIQDTLAGTVEGDIRDYDRIAKIFSKYAIDTCFHLAAQPIVSTGFTSPLPTFDTNIMGTINVLEAARRTPALKRLVVASSTHVYGNNPDLPYVESLYPRPSRPYETSKACADMLAQTYYHTFGLPVAIARPTNTYGPGDLNFSRLVPKVMRAVVSREDPKIVGGSSIRDYLYVRDAVLGYLRLAENLDRPEIQGRVFNFGSGQVMSAADMAQKIIDANSHPGLRLHVQPAPAPELEISRQYVSIQKAGSLLNWHPTHPTHDSLRETLAWYRGLLVRPKVSA